MSDQSQGEGWWIASDGKWYPPHLHPDYVAPAPAPTPLPTNPPAVRAFQRQQPAQTEPPGGSAPAASAPGKSRPQLLVLACAGVIALSCFLPWAEVQFIGTITASGIDGGDGWIFLAGAAVIAVVAWLREPGVPVLILSILGVVGFILERWNIGTVSDDAGFAISIGVGLWLILAASLVAFATAVHHLTAAPAPTVSSGGSDGLGPLLRRYWWALSILGALLVGAIALGTDDHTSGDDVATFGFDDDSESNSASFGLDTSTTEKRAPVRLNVLDAGFSTYTDYDDSTAVTAGAVIENRGDDEVPGTEVVFNLLGADGKPVGTETATIPAIEPGGRSSVSVSGVSVTGPVASIDVTTVVDEDSFDYYAPIVLAVADEAVGKEQFGGYTITGNARNPGTSVVDGASIDCVVRRSGVIVGGASGYLDTLPGGQTNAFEVRFSANDITIDSAECSASTYG